MSLKRIFLLSLCLTVPAWAQSQQSPKVKVNLLNVCTPSVEEQKEISSALSRAPKQPLFSPDFEVDRGRTTLSDNPGFLQAGESAQISADSSVASWVRIRREFSVQALFSTVQYSFSVDPKSMVETLVFKVRDPKELMELTIEDSASAVTSPAAMLATSTPTTRIRLERFGKSSVVLARCMGTENSPPPDQTAYEPLFQTATGVVGSYRGLLGARQIVPEELARTNAGAKKKPTAKADGEKPAAKKP